MEDANIFEIFYLVVLAGTILVVYKQAMSMIVISFTILTILLFLMRKLNKSRSPVDGKTIFITGVDSDIGNQLSKRLVDFGFHVLASSVSLESPRVQELKRYHNKLIVLEMDVTSDQSCYNSLTQVKTNLGSKGLYALINVSNNMAVKRDIELTNMDEYQLPMESNILGTIRVTKLFLPLIRESKGCIVNVSSVSGLIGLPQQSAHTITHFALEGFTESLRLEMKKFDVRVSIIECSMDYNVQAQASKNKSGDPVSEEILNTYGEEYINSYKNADPVAQLNLTITPILERVLDSLLSQQHTSRYLVASKLTDKTAILTIIRQFIPITLLDYFNLWINGPILDTEYEKIKFGLKTTEPDKKTS